MRETDDHSSCPQANSRYESKQRRLVTEISLTGEVNSKLAEVARNKAGATVVSNRTARQFLSIANLTHTNVESELVSVAGV